MVHIKVMYANENGKFELTKDELEDMLNSAYEEGKNDYCLTKMTCIASSAYQDTNSAQVREC